MTGLHPEVLPPDQREALERLAPVLDPGGFYLGGGTAVALQVGHRRSLDLDWFTREPMGDPLVLARSLEETGIEWEVESVDEGTLHAYATGVRVSFLEFRYPFLRPTIEAGEFGCRLAALEDLACMKLSAVAQRGERKDFIDLHVLGERIDLPEMLDLYREKFEVRDIGHVLHSLTYFDEAEATETPAMLVDLSWDEVKDELRRRVREFVRGRGGST